MSTLSKLSKLEVSRGLRMRGRKGAGSCRASSARQSMRENHLCFLISAAPRPGSEPRRFSGLTWGWH